MELTAFVVSLRDPRKMIESPRKLVAVDLRVTGYDSLDGLTQVGAIYDIPIYQYLPPDLQRNHAVQAWVAKVRPNSKFVVAPTRTLTGINHETPGWTLLADMEQVGSLHEIPIYQFVRPNARRDFDTDALLDWMGS